MMSLTEALIGSGVVHDEFNLVINESKNSFRMKEIVRAKHDKLSEVERDRLAGRRKKIGRDVTSEIQRLKVKNDVGNQNIKFIEILGECCHIFKAREEYR